MANLEGLLWSRGHQLGNEQYYRQGGSKSWFPQIIIGAQYVEASLVAWVLKTQKDAVAFAYTGDGFISGDTYEGINFASATKAPLVPLLKIMVMRSQHHVNSKQQHLT